MKTNFTISSSQFLTFSSSVSGILAAGGWLLAIALSPRRPVVLRLPSKVFWQLATGNWLLAIAPSFFPVFQYCGAWNRRFSFELCSCASCKISSLTRGVTIQGNSYSKFIRAVGSFTPGYKYFTPLIKKNIFRSLTHFQIVKFLRSTPSVSKSFHCSLFISHCSFFHSPHLPYFTTPSLTRYSAICTAFSAAPFLI